MKGPKEPAITQEKLRQTTDSKTLAQAEGNPPPYHTHTHTQTHTHAVNGLERENEAVKLMTVRGGLLDLSQAWKGMGNKCNIIADSQKVPPPPPPPPPHTHTHLHPLPPYRSWHCSFQTWVLPEFRRFPRTLAPERAVEWCTVRALDWSCYNHHSMALNVSHCTLHVVMY